MEFHIVYASQTGVAEDLAMQAALYAHRVGYTVRLSAFDDFGPAQIGAARRAAFFVSTAGDGEVPDNMKRMWPLLLRKDLPNTAMAHLQTTVFGCGDSSYDKYNAAARRLCVRLAQLGSPPLCERGLGDDQSPLGVSHDFDQWCASAFVPALLQGKGVAGASPADIADITTPVRHILVSCAPRPAAGPSGNGGAGQRAADGGGPLGSGSFSPARPAAGTGDLQPARLAQARRLTAPDWWQEVRMMSFEWPAGTPYLAGDVLAVQPCALAGDGPGVIARLARRLGWVPPTADDAEAIDKLKHLQLTVAPAAARGPAEAADVVRPVLAGHEALWAQQPPGACEDAPRVARSWPTGVVSLWELLTVHADVQAMPKRWALQQLSLYADDQEQREKLQELAVSEGADLYHEYVRREQRTLADVLEDFGSISTIPLGLLLELVPPMRQREFSIASSHAMRPDRLDLIVATVDEATPSGRRRHRGVCTSMLSRMAAGDSVLVRLRSGSSLRLPAGAALPPALLVGPGTGIAPMRALVQEMAVRRGLGAAAREAVGCGQPATRNAVASASEAPPATALPGGSGAGMRLAVFCGHRHAAKDDLIGPELRRLQGVGVVDLLHVAFSRDQARKVYVHSKIVQEADTVAAALCDGGAHVFISGRANGMPRNVKDALALAIVRSGTAPDALRAPPVTGSVVPPEHPATAFVRTLERTGRIHIEAW